MMAPPAIRTGRLDVFLLGRRAGTLDYSSRGNEMRFAYDPAYAADPAAPALSFSLPVRTEPYGTGQTTEFFANLLPPEVVRKKLGPVLHLSRHNLFGFLEALGADCAGAISIRKPGDPVPGSDEERLLELDDARAAEVLGSLSRRPLYAGGVDGYRISGSGAQDKLVARIVGGRIVLPLFGTPSTHLLKPPLRDYPDSVFNEWFAMSLAGRAGLPTAKCGILDVGGIPCYWTERFDRTQNRSGRVLRLHQEDFCQALGADGERKYESEGGPSVSDSVSLLRSMRLGIRQELRFLDAVAFHVMIGNADAHAKNFAVLYRGNKAELAPVYDAVSTMVYTTLSREAAMSIGGQKGIDRIGRGDFERMARDLGIAPALVLRRVDALAAKLREAAPVLAEEFARLRPSPVYAHIRGILESQMARISPENPELPPNP